jgi:hypothetical protein
MNIDCFRNQVDGLSFNKTRANCWFTCGASRARPFLFGTSSIVARQRHPEGDGLVKTTKHSNDVDQTPDSAAAAQMRLHRRRQRIRCVTIQLHQAEVEALVRKGWLKAEMRNHPAALVEALHGHLGYSLLGERDV